MSSINSQTLIQPLFGGTGAFRIIRRGGARLVTAYRIYQERRALADLDSRLLSDVGLTGTDAAHEAERPFFDLPAGRD